MVDRWPHQNVTSGPPSSGRGHPLG